MSLAAAHAAAAEEGLPLWRYLGGDAAHVLPVPMMNVLNGGAHADNKVDFQEFMVVPVGAPIFHEALRTGAEVFHALKKTLARARASAPAAATRAASRPTSAPTRRRCRCSSAGIEAAGYTPGDDVAIALDPATSEIFKDGAYVLEAEGRSLTPDEMAAYWADLAGRYPIVSLEDGMDEEDWDGWRTLTDRVGEHLQLVGDDLFVTNTERLKRGIDSGVGELDPRQGQPDRHADRDARRDRAPRARPGYTAVMSHRSGETEDVDDRRPRRRDRLRPDQDRRAVALGPRREVQPAAAHRGGARRRRDVPGAQRLPLVTRASDAEREAVVAPAARRGGRGPADGRGARRAHRRRLRRGDARRARAAHRRPARPPRRARRPRPSGGDAGRPRRRRAPSLVLGILGGGDRRGRWRVPERMTVVNVLGGADLDLREATLAAPEVEITGRLAASAART